jgi:hypothetical protein
MTDAKVNQGAITIQRVLKDAGLPVDGTLSAQAFDGYVVISSQDADLRDTCDPIHRDNIPETPIESDFEMQLVGNRLWELGETYRESGQDYIADETQHLARRFHAAAKDEENDD